MLLLILMKLKFILEKCLLKDRLIRRKNSRLWLIILNEINRYWRKLLELWKILLKLWICLDHNLYALLSLDWSNVSRNNLMKGITVLLRQLNRRIIHILKLKLLSWVKWSLVKRHQWRIALKGEARLWMIILIQLVHYVKWWLQYYEGSNWKECLKLVCLKSICDY